MQSKTTFNLADFLLYERNEPGQSQAVFYEGADEQFAQKVRNIIHDEEAKANSETLMVDYLTGIRDRIQTELGPFDSIGQVLYVAHAVAALSGYRAGYSAGFGEGADSVVSALSAVRLPGRVIEIGFDVGNKPSQSVEQIIGFGGKSGQA